MPQRAVKVALSCYLTLTGYAPFPKIDQMRMENTSNKLQNNQKEIYIDKRNIINIKKRHI